MSWITYHSQSEEYAIQAESALKKADKSGAEALYRLAAEAEEKALSALDASKTRTIGITAVSATSLWFKANEFQLAERLACNWIASGTLPEFAIEQLQNILKTIWNEQDFRQSGIEYIRGQLAISLAGGEIATGAAPLRLVNRKADEISNFFYRIIEMILGHGFRKHGPPSTDITDNFRPWIFQAPPGSYQFSIRLQKPSMQLSLFPDKSPEVEEVTKKFMQILRTATQETWEELERIVDNYDYRIGFLRMSRNLAPTGRIFNSLEIKSTNDPDVFPIILFPDSRYKLNETLRYQRDAMSQDTHEEQITGILRALHLDNDWLEISQDNGGLIRVDQTGDIIDDIVGPMVNQKVTVDVVFSNASGRYLYRDIQLEE